MFLLKKTSWNDDKRIRTFVSKNLCVYGTNKDLASEREEIKCNNTIKRYKNN